MRGGGGDGNVSAQDTPRLRHPQARGGTRFALAGGGALSWDGTHGERGGHVARNPWRIRARMAGVVLVAVLSGIVVGMLLVHLLLAPNRGQP